MLVGLQYRILNRIAQGEHEVGSNRGMGSNHRLSQLFGATFLESIHGRTVIDFGCGEGLESVEIARSGAAKVIGIDIRQDVLTAARSHASAMGMGELCHFGSATNEQAHVLVCIDAFEHFADPAAALQLMDQLLLPGGEVFAAFGPPWYHPRGGHTFSVFPWAHLLFAEKALIRWRSGFKSDGATCFSEVAGGLNQMTIGRFLRLVQDSSFTCAEFEAVPIRRLRLLHSVLTREFTTALVRCRLSKAPLGEGVRF